LPSNSSDWIRIGQIVGTFGLKGQVKVLPLTEFWSRFEKGSRLRLNGDWVTVEGVTEHKAQLHLKLSGIKHIDAAEQLKWAYLEAPSSETPTLEEDEFLTSDLIGLNAETIEGEELGKVEDVLQAPAHDVLVIGEIMVPAVKEFVKQVDIPGNRIVVQLIFGMRPGEE
jgi:16S rRNA processing protein RimM